MLRRYDQTSNRANQIGQIEYVDIIILAYLNVIFWVGMLVSRQSKFKA